MVRTNDLISISSGVSHIGINGGPNGAFDIASMAPYGHIIQLSGIFLDPILGQSGVIRYSRAANSFQSSVDGGLTFANLATAGNTVTSVGVLGGADLTGNVDFTSTSGFIVITDNGGASPISWDVDVWGLSGLFMFPAQGFNGRVVNALTDFNGTEAQGVLSVVGASGILVDIVGQTVTIAGNGIGRCYSETFSLARTWTVTHNLGSTRVIVFVVDDSSPPEHIIADSIQVTDSNNVTITHNQRQAGTVTVMAC